MATLPVRIPLLVLTLLAMAVVAGCSSKHGNSRYAAQGSKCYAKALPSSGEGGLAFGPTLAMASKKSLDSCVRYASRSGGTPRTCQVVLAKCKG
ncbi:MULTISPECIES: hypothetical protein [unclassified Pseudomonas]|uniref:hypothetical protein n=1 Tax=unclassified Pseudomonas TaxID=196821 RepID=UPI002097DF0D|nr:MULTISPECIES: hypothetical protein [unclassified Pseudomonas]MCO7521007.1 hypothetical protein [Pseudomonas sp. 1]MCO7542745.1 hypothetical protein [Pseudomonas sp. VA159-2]